MLRKIGGLLLDPVVVFWLLFVGSLFFRKKKRRIFVYMATAAFVWLALVTTPPLPEFLVSSLEWKFTPFQPAREFPSKAHILVLGGGHISDERLPVNDQLSDQALKRLVEGVRIHNLLPDSKLILSGYSSVSNLPSHAEKLGETALLLGVNPEDTLLVDTPWNTMYEAIDYQKKFGNEHPLILVTSAIHMPRARMHFQRAGLDPVPAPTDYMIKRDQLPKGIRIFPSGGNSSKMSKAYHEYVGMIVGKMEWKQYLKRKQVREVN